MAGEWRDAGEGGGGAAGGGERDNWDGRDGLMRRWALSKKQGIQE